MNYIIINNNIFHLFQSNLIISPNECKDGDTFIYINAKDQEYFNHEVNIMPKYLISLEQASVNLPDGEYACNVGELTIIFKKHNGHWQQNINYVTENISTISLGLLLKDKIPFHRTMLIYYCHRYRIILCLLVFFSYCLGRYYNFIYLLKDFLAS